MNRVGQTTFRGTRGGPGSGRDSMNGMGVLKRSLLYVPASSEKMLHKAGHRGADVLILDLEDGVHPDVKAEARERMADAMRRVDWGGSAVLVRINGLDSPWGVDDLDQLRWLRPSGVVLPKVSHCEQVESADAKLGQSIALYLMVETAAGVLAAPRLAQCSPRVRGLLFGAADFRESLRAGQNPDELELHFARSQIVLAARAAGIDAFDTPWFAYADTDGLRRSSQRARWMGFDGKTAIHPGQIPVINEIFAPSPAEIERARRVLAAMEEALAGGRYVTTLDGVMIEALHVNEAERTLARAKAAGKL